MFQLRFETEDGEHEAIFAIDGPKDALRLKALAWEEELRHECSIRVIEPPTCLFGHYSLVSVEDEDGVSYQDVAEELDGLDGLDEQLGWKRALNG